MDKVNGETMMTKKWKKKVRNYKLLSLWRFFVSCRFFRFVYFYHSSLSCYAFCTFRFPQNRIVKDQIRKSVCIPYHLSLSILEVKQSA